MDVSEEPYRALISEVSMAGSLWRRSEGGRVVLSRVEKEGRVMVARLGW